MVRKKAEKMMRKRAHQQVKQAEARAKAKAEAKESSEKATAAKRRKLAQERKGKIERKSALHDELATQKNFAKASKQYKATINAAKQATVAPDNKWHGVAKKDATKASTQVLAKAAAQKNAAMAANGFGEFMSAAASGAADELNAKRQPASEHEKFVAELQ